MFAHWGEGRTIHVWDPVIAASNRSTVAMLERTSATPSVAAAMYEAAATSDVRDVLSLVQAPTRVLHHPSYSFPRALNVDDEQGAGHAASLIKAV